MENTDVWERSNLNRYMRSIMIYVQKKYFSNYDSFIDAGFPIYSYHLISRAMTDYPYGEEDKHVANCINWLETFLENQ